MRKFTFKIATLTIFSLFTFHFSLLLGQAVPNPYFANWNLTTWQNPQYYNTSNGDNNNGNNMVVNAVRTTNAFHGKYAIQVTSVKVGQDTVAGYVVNGKPNGGKVMGGIPYTQKAIGISLHYIYKITTRDTALIIVWFKLKGSVIGQYEVPLIDTTSVYKLATGTFTPALTQTPDTVVFGAVASSNIMNNGDGRPGSVLTVDSVNFTGVTSQPADMNGDFENWSAPDTAFIPSGWYGYYPGTYRSTDAYTGCTYSAEMKTVVDSSQENEVISGEISTGYYQCPNNCDSNCDCPEKGGYPYTQTADTLIFWYKYAPTTGDTGGVYVNFIKDTGYWGTGMNLFSTGGKWMEGKVGFNGVSPAPDSVAVAFVSSSHNTNNGGTPPQYLGSILKVDDIYFKSQPLGIDELKAEDGHIAVYPNPAGQMLYLDFSPQFGQQPASISVTDILGNVVMESQENIHAGTPMALNISALAPGMYFVRVNTGTYSNVEKFIKQ